MPKQLGIHQIRGKFGELSYYKQKYIRPGLIKSINPNMSERLKTDPIFVNTRKNSREFGMCSNLAAAIINSLPSRSELILRPFLLPDLTAFLRNMLNSMNGPYGSREFKFYPDEMSQLFGFIEKYAKVRWRDYFPAVNVVPNLSGTEEGYPLTLNTRRFKDYIDKNGYDVIRLSVYQYAYISVPLWYGNTGYTKALVQPADLQTNYDITKDSEDEIVLDFAKAPEQADQLQYELLIAVPGKGISGDYVFYNTGASMQILPYWYSEV